MMESDPVILANHRILIVDDNRDIHEDFEKTLPCNRSPAQAHLEEQINHTAEKLFGTRKEFQPAVVGYPVFDLDHAYQGQEAYKKVLSAVEDGNPYALLFVDVRMPPGWDGIETVRRIWEDYAHAEIVICSAYSDYSWEDILVKLGPSDRLQFLRKPFDVVSVKQMALALTQKWNLAEQARHYTEQLELKVAKRTKELKRKLEELKRAMREISELREILPMCAWCHKIRTDDDYWHKVDEYLDRHINVDISHSICPDCFKKLESEMDDAEIPLRTPSQIPRLRDSKPATKGK